MAKKAASPDPAGPRSDDDVEAEGQDGEGGGIGRGVDVAFVAVDQGEEKKEKRDICRDQAATPIRGIRRHRPRSRRRPASSATRIRSSAVPGACLRNGCALSSRNKGLGEEDVAT